jgi:hypothetical protein
MKALEQIRSKTVLVTTFIKRSVLEERGPDRKDAMIAAALCQRPPGAVTISQEDPPIARFVFFCAGNRNGINEYVMSTRLSVCLRTLLGTCFLAFAVAVTAAEDKVLFESLKIGGTEVKNVRVKDVTPTHVTVYYDGGGSQLKREDLPPELKKLYPYDAREAAAYEKKQAEQKQKNMEETRKRQEQLSQERKGVLQKQELTIQAKLTELQRELEKLNHEMDPMRAKAQGKKRSAARKELDVARDKKRELIRSIDEQKDLLAKVRKQLN